MVYNCVFRTKLMLRKFLGLLANLWKRYLIAAAENYRSGDAVLNIGLPSFECGFMLSLLIMVVIQDPV